MATHPSLSALPSNALSVAFLGVTVSSLPPMNVEFSGIQFLFRLLKSLLVLIWGWIQYFIPNVAKPLA